MKILHCLNLQGALIRDRLSISCEIRVSYKVGKIRLYAGAPTENDRVASAKCVLL